MNAHSKTPFALPSKVLTRSGRGTATGRTTQAPMPVACVVPMMNSCVAFVLSTRATLHGNDQGGHEHA